MVCLNHCLIGFILICGKIFCLFSYNDNKYHDAFVKTLYPRQFEIYQEIIAERRGIYYQGLVIGVILALIVTMKVYRGKNQINKACLFATIALGTNFLYYSIMPKSQYMLSHLNEKRQIDLWLELYRNMKKSYIYGILFGLLGYFLLFYGILKNN